MTLSQAVTRFRTRFDVDLECEIDSSNNDAVVDALMVAARETSRDTYMLWTWKSALTLTSGVDEIDLLSTSVSAKRIFHCYGLWINDTVVQKLDPADFITAAPAFYKDSSQSYVTYWVGEFDSTIRLNPPPNATAVASAYNYACGFYEHDTYTWAANQSTELEGPTVFHDLIIDKATLNTGVSYTEGTGYERRKVIEARYYDKASRFKADNLAKYRPAAARATKTGCARRVYGLGPVY